MASAREKERFDASSNDEKAAEGARGIETVDDPNSDVADPDAGLSEEERATAVCYRVDVGQLHKLTRTAGSQAALEARCQAHSLAVVFVSHIVPRPDEHRYVTSVSSGQRLGRLATDGDIE
jgi:hypothetical protein